MSNAGQMHAQTIATQRRTDGSPVTVGGVATYAITLTLSATQASAFLPDGKLNAANGAPRLFNVTPADFVGTAFTQAEDFEGAQVVWPFGSPQTVIHAEPEIYGGVLISWRLACYRSPVEGTSTQDGATGLRKPFAPPDQT